MSEKLRIKNAMILAAGFGKRLQPVIGDLPKPLVDLGGKTALEISIEGLNAIDEIENIYINVHWQRQKIKDFLRHVKTDKNIYLIEEEKILETGGGIFNVMSQLNGDDLLIKNSDVVFLGKKSYYDDLIKLYKSRNDLDALLVMAEKADNMKGDFNFGEQNYIFRDNNDSNTHTYAGCSILSKKMFVGIDKIKPFPLSDLLFLADKDNYRQYQYGGYLLPKTIKWFDIGTPERLVIARNIIQENSAIEKCECF